MDLYSKKLAERLEVPKLYTNIYQDVAEIYNIPFLSIKAATALLKELSFVKKLNRVNGVIHIPNHHLGRYGFFLKVPYIITVHDLIRYFDLKGYFAFIGILDSICNQIDQYLSQLARINCNIQGKVSGQRHV